jgi:hypothetical protein
MLIGDEAKKILDTDALTTPMRHHADPALTSSQQHEHIWIMLQAFSGAKKKETQKPEILQNKANSNAFTAAAKEWRSASK